MLRRTKVLSISLAPEVMGILENLTRNTSKTRSEIIRDLLVSYQKDKSWEQLFTWGRQAKEKFNIKSEEDIIKLINN